MTLLAILALGALAWLLLALGLGVLAGRTLAALDNAPPPPVERPRHLRVVR